MHERSAFRPRSASLESFKSAMDCSALANTPDLQSPQPLRDNSALVQMEIPTTDEQAKHAQDTKPNNHSPLLPKSALSAPKFKLIKSKSSPFISSPLARRNTINNQIADDVKFKYY